MKKDQLKQVIEGALLAYGQPLTIHKLQSLFITENAESDAAVTDTLISQEDIHVALQEIQQECASHGFELKKVSSGWRFQVKQDMAPWVNKLWEEKPQRYSRALMETLAIIAYRQPITRGDIEEIRGVAVSSHIIKTLSEREWVKVIGHRDVLGRPALYATTKQFLDYFNLESLDELPSLKELTDIEALIPELNLEEKPEAGTTKDNIDNNTQENTAVTESTVAEKNIKDDEQVIH